MASDEVTIRLVGIEGGRKSFWRATRRDNIIDLHQGDFRTEGEGAGSGADPGEPSDEGKRDTRSFADASVARTYLSKQLALRIDRGFYADLPFRITTWAEVKDEVCAVLPGNHEQDSDRVLVVDGDAAVPHNLWLDYRRGMLALLDESEPPLAGLIVRGNLTLAGCLYNYEDDHGPFLLVTGGLTARAIATGGARIHVAGALSADTIVGVYNHGSLVAAGPLRAKIIATEHTVSGAPLSALVYRGWGRIVLPVRDGVADETEPYEPRQLFAPVVLKGSSVDLARARELAVAGKSIAKESPLSVRAAFRKLMGKKFAEPDKVKSLSLSGKELTFLPEELFTFRKLEKLILTHNKLRELPEELGLLTELRELQLRGNGLRELPESIGKLTKLRVLDLEANCLWRLPDSLASCTELRIVNLTNNPYSYLRSAFGGWNKVRIMWKYPEVLTRLPKLEQVIFDGTFIRHLPQRRFDSPNLSRAVIKGSLVLEVDPLLHGQLQVHAGESHDRAVNTIRYWFDSDEIHLEDFYDSKRDAYDFAQIDAILCLLLEINIPTAAPYHAALAEFEKQCADVIRSLSWGGKHTRHVHALFRALGEALDRFEPRYPPGNALIAGLRPMFARHAGQAGQPPAS